MIFLRLANSASFGVAFLIMLGTRSFGFWECETLRLPKRNTTARISRFLFMGGLGDHNRFTENIDPDIENPVGDLLHAGAEGDIERIDMALGECLLVFEQAFVLTLG